MERNSQKLVDFCWHLNYEEIPEDVIKKTKQCVLDYLGVAIGGAQTETGKNVIASSQWLGKEGKSRLLGTTQTASAIAAAFANGTQSEVLELQDGWRFGNIHACVVIPAALAIADEKPTDGKKFLKSVVCGYELANRIAHTMHPNHLAKGYLPTGTAGTCGSALTSAIVLDADLEETQQAVGIASFLLPVTTAENLWGGYSIKPFHSGQAAKEGIVSARLAMQKFEACPLEGSPERGRGWCDITTGEVKYERLLLNLGTNYTISDVYFKVYPFCRHAHHAGEAALVLSRRLKETSGIGRVIVKTYDLAAGLLNRYPHYSSNQVAYQFSIPYVVSFALLRKNLSYLNYIVENLHDEDIVALAKKVELIGDAELTAVYPNVTPSIIEVYDKEGRLIDTQRCDMPKGDPRTPVTEEELEDKFNGLVIPAIGEKGARELKDMIDHLERLEDVSALGETVNRYLLAAGRK